MNKSKVFVVSVLTLSMSLGAVAGPEHEHGDKKESKGNYSTVLPKCPVMGGPVNFLVNTVTVDGPVYFCCEGCIEKYKAEPEKYAKKVADQRSALKKLPRIQVTCPVTGLPVDGKSSIEHNGEKVFFSGSNSLAKFKKEPSKYKVGLADSYTYQVKCPVLGGDINPQYFTVLAGGQKIYFCCPGCETQLFKDPDKYTPKLKAQGFIITPEQIKPALKDSSGTHEHKGHDHGGHTHCDH